MRFLDNGDLNFIDLEKLMFEGGIKRVGQGRKVKANRRKDAAAAANRGPLFREKEPRQQFHRRNEHDAPVLFFELTAVVSNIPASAKQEDVSNYFNDRCGKVVDVKFVPNNNTIACVEFAEASSMNKALHGLANPEILGVPVFIRSSLDIKKQIHTKSRKDTITTLRGDAGSHMNLSDKGPMNTSGDLSNINPNLVNPNLGSMSNPNLKAGPSLNILGSSGGTVNPADTMAKKIRVNGLAKMATEQDVRRIFASYGEIESIDIRSGQTKCNTCDIVFKNPQTATDATIAMDGYSFCGEMLSVSQATQAPPTASGMRGNWMRM